MALNSKQWLHLREAMRLGLISAERLEAVRIAENQARSDTLNSGDAAKRQVRRLTEDIRGAELAVKMAQRELEMGLVGLEDFNEKERRLTALKAHRLNSDQARGKRVEHEQFPEDIVRAIRLMESLCFVIEQVCAQAGGSHLAGNSPLGERDAEICRAWASVRSEMRNSTAPWESGIDAYRWLQLLSARNAECVARTYYETLGLAVQDVSATQLSPEESDWKYFDLRVGSRAVDVKNSRESLNGNGNYVEHCVPHFKRERGGGSHVRIAGVLSPYLTDPSAYFQSPQPAIFLGEAGIEDARGLYRWARHRFSASLDLRGLWTPGFLPGWMFEMPPEHYAKRDKAIQRARDLLPRLLEAGAHPIELPAWLWIYSDLTVPSDHPKARLIEEIRAIDGAIGISRRSLYVYAIGLAMESIIGENSGVDRLAGFMDAMVIADRTGPISGALGLSDPGRYVASVCQLLVSVVNSVREMGLRLTGFLLIHPAILKGKRDDGSLVSLIAYCGGWQRYPTAARCGATPLTIAEHTLCPSCAHLICGHCGHCHDRCIECEPRQERAAARQEAHDARRSEIE